MNYSANPAGMSVVQKKNQKLIFSSSNSLSLSILCKKASCNYKAHSDAPNRLLIDFCYGSCSALKKEDCHVFTIFSQ